MVPSHFTILNPDKNIVSFPIDCLTQRAYHYYQFWLVFILVLGEISRNISKTTFQDACYYSFLVPNYMWSSILPSLQRKCYSAIHVTVIFRNAQNFRKKILRSIIKNIKDFTTITTSQETFEVNMRMTNFFSDIM